MRIASYADAERYLESTINEIASVRTAYKLDRMHVLLRDLGNPHRAFPTIHVGGTSGKGSTSTMIASALQASGKKTGLHTKPHLHAMTERARIDDAAIAPERLAELLDQMMPAIERTAATHGRPTYYETLLALAFAHFAAERVDVAVVEVGLGGRLDGTNVVLPRVAAITSVGFDHTDVLGNTIEEIAREKAGIAKPGVPLVIGYVPQAAAAIIEEVAREAGATVAYVRDLVDIEVLNSDEQALELAATTQRGTYSFALGVLGRFQHLNAATAIAVLEQLGDDLRPSGEAIARGLSGVVLPGRMELFRTKPDVVLDIAHNAEKAQSLAASLAQSFPGRRFHFVVAVGVSKDARAIVEAFARLPSTFTFTSFETQGRQATPPSQLATVAATLGIYGRAIPDPIEALTVARRIAGRDDVVVVTGSTFVVARLREWYGAAAV
jgi:dihydrofolate synthase/folylpolyglutamate synthase